MNRKLQDLDRQFIIARQHRDPHAFNARTEAEKYSVSVRTIHSVISAAGVKMKRGRKTLIAPSCPASRAEGRIDPNGVVEPSDNLGPRDTLDLLEHIYTPKPPVTPKPPITPQIARRGPPIIRRKAE